MIQLDALDAAALAVFFLAGIVALFVFWPVLFPAPFGPCASEPTLEEQTRCMAGLALDAGNLSACLDTPEPDACAGAYAHSQGALNACAAWREPDACGLDFARQRLLSGNASVSEINAICLSLSEDFRRDPCLLEAAWVLNDSSLCPFISREYLRLECGRPFGETP